jgi:hypothetical protein
VELEPAEYDAKEFAYHAFTVQVTENELDLADALFEE